jgi:hypothetical protein
VATKVIVGEHVLEPYEVARDWLRSFMFINEPVRMVAQKNDGLRSLSASVSEWPQPNPLEPILLELPDESVGICLVATKVRKVLSEILGDDRSGIQIVIGLRTIPTIRSVRFIANHIAGKRCHFVGDLSPYDVISFLILRHELSAADQPLLFWRGICDDWFQCLTIGRSSESGRANGYLRPDERNYLVKNSSSEVNVWHRLRADQDENLEFLGERCLSLLDEGMSWHLEGILALVRARNGSSSVLREAILSTSLRLIRLGGHPEALQREIPRQPGDFKCTETANHAPSKHISRHLVFLRGSLRVPENGPRHLRAP